MNLNTITTQNQSCTAKLDQTQSCKNNENSAAKSDELQFYNNNENFEIPNNELEYDKFVNNSINNSQEKVSFKEGVKLIGKGFVNKLKNMATSIIQHPVKALGAVGATALLISAAPLIGVASATAGAFLALGFAAYAIGKTGLDVAETIKDNKEGRYDEVRQDLEQIGGDGVDLALSLPFAPKAINQVSRFARYGRETVGLNTELLANLKNCHNYSDVRFEFAKADTLINYEMIGNEMGLAVKPEVKFTNNGVTVPSYDNVSGKVEIPEQLITPQGKKIMRNQGKNIEIELRHELEHFKQASDIAKTYGTETLKQQMVENYKYTYQENGGILDKSNPAFENNKKVTLEKFGDHKNQVENMLFGDGSSFNEKIYQDVINKQGMYETSSSKAAKAAEYSTGIMEKATKAKEIGELLQNGNREAAMKLYFDNVLEHEARAAENIYKTQVVKGRPTIVNDAIMADAAIEEYFSEDDLKLIGPDESLYSKLNKKSK